MLVETRSVNEGSREGEKRREKGEKEGRGIGLPFRERTDASMLAAAADPSTLDVLTEMLGWQSIELVSKGQVNAAAQRRAARGEQLARLLSGSRVDRAASGVRCEERPPALERGG